MAVLTLNYLPVGYRFSPTDEELVNFYLKLKIEGHDKKVEAIPEVDVCKWEPWDLPNLSVIKNEDPEWFFFCPRDQKYPKGRRSNRATEKGYWKATGKDRTIKARSAGMKLIGMKKTLVFHIGRAPGGQRTAWIMHEYRMTSEEGPFVLCRLFNKEKAESNCDETEPTGFSPTATSSSPESMRVEKTMVQATPESDMQAGENPTGIKRWLEDKSDNNTSTTSLPEQSYSNSCHASDVDDHETELRGVQVDAQQGEYKGILDDPTHESLDQALLAPLHVETSTGLGPFNVNSTFANEFCNTHNEMVDQDWSPADLEFLEKVFNNQGDGDDTSSLKHSSVRSEPDVASFCVHQSLDSIFGKESGSTTDTDNEVLQVQAYPAIFGKESGSTTDTDNEVLQVQAYPELEAFGGAVNTNESLQLQKALELNDGFYGEEFWNGNLDILMCDPPPALDSSSVESPTYYQTTGSLHRATPVDDTKNTIGTGVKIRSRHPQYNSSSQNLVYQGTAPRRLRLQRKLTRRVTSFKGRESSCNANDQDVKPRVSEATGENAIPASEDGSEISRELEKRPRPRLRPNSIKAQSRREVIKSDQQDSSLIAKAPLIRPFTYSLRYMVSAALIMIIMAVLFVSAWRCLAT